MSRTIRLAAAALAVPVLVAVAPAATADAKHPRIATAMRTVVAQKGEPYVYGAAGPRSFDCSGLTQYSFGRAGFHLPRTAAQQAGAVRRIKTKNLRRGDFVFYYGPSGVYHMSVFSDRNGGRHVIEASRPGTSVSRNPMWTAPFFAGTLRHR